MSTLYTDIVPSFSPITLSEMDKVKLMNRVDTKYLLSINSLPDVLKKASSDYRMVEIANKRVLGYDSLYFDTTDHEMYIKHHNRKLNRHKIRIRQYLDSKVFFLEIKFKNNKGRTSKKRISVDGIHSINEPEAAAFIEQNSLYKSEQLVPTLFTTFQRITLVSKQRSERITLDINLDLHNEFKQAVLPFLVIIEVKSEFVSTTEGFARILRDERVFPKRISKYCTGTNLLFPELKRNRFKPKLFYLKKLDNTTNYDQLNSAII